MLKGTFIMLFFSLRANEILLDIISGTENPYMAQYFNVGMRLRLLVI